MTPPLPVGSPRFPVSSKLERVCAAALALVLLRSTFAHLSNPYVFLDSVYSYQIVPEAVGPWIAALTPWFQMVLAVCLLAKWWPRTAYALAFALFLTFVAAQSLTLSRGLDISCGCFGSSGGLKVGWLTLSLAGGCALVCVLGFTLTPKEVMPCDTAATLSP